MHVRCAATLGTTHTPGAAAWRLGTPPPLAGGWQGVECKLLGAHLGHGFEAGFLQWRRWESVSAVWWLATPPGGRARPR